MIINRNTGLNKSVFQPEVLFTLTPKYFIFPDVTGLKRFQINPKSVHPWDKTVVNRPLKGYQPAFANMHTCNRNRILLYCILVHCLFVPAALSYSAVLAFDTIMVKGLSAQISVQTRRVIFPFGGGRVALFFGQKSLGTILTGGDGYGFLTVIPEKTGLIDVTAYFDGKKDSGTVLVVEKEFTQAAVAIEIEAGLGKASFSKRFKRDSRKTVALLNDRFPIIYLTRFIGISLSRTLLYRNNYPRSVVLRWHGSRTIDWLSSKGIFLHAVIASASLLAECPQNIAHRISFEEIEDGVTVADWIEIREQLK